MDELRIEMTPAPQPDPVELMPGAQVVFTGPSGFTQIRRKPIAEAILRAGEVVYEKITGRGPFVLVERAEIEVESEAPTQQPGQTKLARTWVATWVVRDRRGRYLSVPEAVLTTDSPEPSKLWRAPRLALLILRAVFCAAVFPARFVLRLATRQPPRTPPCPTCPFCPPE